MISAGVWTLMKTKSCLLLIISQHLTVSRYNNQFSPSLPQGSLSNERDYESIVMMRMRQAAERQKLIEQMQREDEEEDAGL